MKLKTFLEKENLNLKFSDKQLNIDIGENLSNKRIETSDGKTIYIYDYSDNNGVLVLDEQGKLISKLTGWNTGYIEGGVAFDENGEQINVN